MYKIGKKLKIALIITLTFAFINVCIALSGGYGEIDYSRPPNCVDSTLTKIVLGR